MVYNNTTEGEINSNIRSQIEAELKSRFSNQPNTKLLKSIDMSSSIHGSEFYSKNLNGMFFKLNFI